MGTHNARIKAVCTSLRTGERLQWIGQPDVDATQLVMRSMRYFGVAFVLLMLGIMAHMQIGALLLQMGWGELSGSMRTTLIVVTLAVLAWLLGKLVAAATPRSDAQQRAQSAVYAVTDQRLIHVDGNERWDTPLAEVRRLELCAFDDGTGSITYTTEEMARRGYPEADTLIWHGVAEAAKVAMLICDVAPHARLRDRSLPSSAPRMPSTL